MIDYRKPNTPRINYSKPVKNTTPRRVVLKAGESINLNTGAVTLNR